MLEVQRQNIVGHCQETFENKKFVDITQHNVYHVGQAIFLNLFYFKGAKTEMSLERGV